MRSDLLHVVTVISNPLRWNSRIRLYHEFCKHMLDSGVNLTTVECVLRDRPHELADIPGVRHVPVRHHTLCWHKESLLKIGFASLPWTAEYIAWIDADIRFRNPDWASETVHMLQQFPVIQPWEHAYDLGPHGRHVGVDSSFCSFHRKRKPICPKWNPNYGFGHPGYAWAARREVLAAMGGLFESAVLGSADHHMAMAFLGRVLETSKMDNSPAYNAALLAWQARAVRHVGPRIGYLQGTIEHQFHGAKANRAYLSRWDILRKHHFNPVSDLQHNLHGVVELTGEKPNLRHDIETYFAQRNEDANTL